MNQANRDALTALLAEWGKQAGRVVRDGGAVDPAWSTHNSGIFDHQTPQLDPAAIAEFLASRGVLVPSVIAHEKHPCFALAMALHRDRSDPAGVIAELEAIAKGEP